MPRNIEKGSQMPSPEEMAKNEKERTLSDAELLKGGAEYKIEEDFIKRLEATPEQIKKAKEEMEIELKIGKDPESKEIYEKLTDDEKLLFGAKATLTEVEYKVNKLLVRKEIDEKTRDEIVEKSQLLFLYAFAPLLEKIKNPEVCKKVSGFAEAITLKRILEKEKKPKEQPKKPSEMTRDEFFKRTPEDPKKEKARLEAEVLRRNKEDFEEIVGIKGKPGEVEIIRRKDQKEKKEREKEKENKKETNINNVSNFSQLYLAIAKKEKMIGSGGEEYSAEYLIKQIDNVRNIIKASGIKEITKELFEESPVWNGAIRTITRNEGLRDRVIELLIKEGEGKDV